MILLLGATGYMGDAFARELQRRNQPFTALSRKETDYSNFEVLLKFLQRTKPEFVVSAAGYTGKPNVDACETARADSVASARGAATAAGCASRHDQSSRQADSASRSRSFETDLSGPVSGWTEAANASADAHGR